MSALDPSIRERIAAQRQRVVRSRAETLGARYEFIRPPECMALDFIDAVTNPGFRLAFGIPEIDHMTRGAGRGELCLITGKAHSAKTWVQLNVVRHNPRRRLLFFTLDESANSIVAKLVGITHGIPTKDLERRLEAGDERIRDLIQRTMTNEYSQLVIVQDSLTFHQMSKSLREAEEHWQARCDGVLLDYVDLLPGPIGYEGTRTKTVGLKRWTQAERVPTLAIHQPRRGGAERGGEITMDDLAQGGDTEAMFVIGVWRQADRLGASMETRERHRNTVTLRLDKNKRSGERHTFDVYLDPQTGAIRPLRPEDQVVPGLPIESAQAAMAYHAHHSRQTVQTTDTVIDLALRRDQREAPA